jgi:hypothetical protein
MKFSAMIEAVQAGEQATNPTLAADGRHVGRDPGGSADLPNPWYYLGHPAGHDAYPGHPTGPRVPWRPSNDDMERDDWEIVS